MKQQTKEGFKILVRIVVPDGAEHGPNKAFKPFAKFQTHTLAILHIFQR